MGVASYSQLHAFCAERVERDGKTKMKEKACPIPGLMDIYLMEIGGVTPRNSLSSHLSSAIPMLDKTLEGRCFMPVPITSIRRGRLNNDSRSNFDTNKVVISLTVKISQTLRYDRLHSCLLGLINFDESLTNCEILHQDL